MSRSRAATVLAGALLLCAACRLQRGSVEGSIGPLQLDGRQDPMAGPLGRSELRFPRGAFITSIETRVRDSAGAPRLHEGLMCHILMRGPARDARNQARKHPGALVEEGTRVTLNEGMEDLRFPDGFGLPVSSGTRYLVAGMLMDERGDRSGSYSLSYRIETRPVEAGLTPLVGLMTFIPPTGRRLDMAHCDDNVWPVPPGRKEFSSSFTMPYDARAHLMVSHLHRYAASYSLEEADTGDVLFRAGVKRDVSGLPLEVPVYSSSEGLPLRDGRRYLYRVVYENTGSAASLGSATLRLFVKPGA